MFRQQIVIFMGFITKEYKNITSIYRFKTSHIRSQKHTEVITIVHTNTMLNIKNGKTTATTTYARTVLFYHF
jgi:hypothetical protein